MKKSLLFVFSALFIFTISIGIMACGKHEHTCQEWLNVVEPTCTEEGSKTGICDDCGEEFTIKVEKIPHTSVAVLGHEATCEGEGLTDGTKCSVCQQELTKQQVIPALGHDWEDWTVIKPADCTHLGQKDRDCKRCLQVEVKDIPMTEHNYDEWHVREEATCVKPGLKYHTCQTCEQEETQVIDMIDHHFDEDGWKTGLEATCTQQGTEINTCTICKKETKTRLTDMKPHTKEKILGQEATCEDEGWTDGEQCSVCHTILTPREVIKAKGHKWSTWQKDSEDRKHKRVCDTCGEEDKESCIYANEVVVDATCLEDGYTTKTCQECGDTIETDRVEKLGHKYENWIPYVVANEKEEWHTHKHYRDCVRCKDEQFRQEGECQLSQEGTVQATCTTDGYIKHVCSECGVVHEEITDRAKGHSLKFVNQTTGYSSARHRQECQNDGCDYVTDWQDCKIYEYVVQATCTTDAISRYSCSICNLKSRDISHQGTAYGHRYSAWTHTGTKEHPQHTQTCLNNCGYTFTEDCQMESVETLPTCTNSGEIKRTCNKCFTSYTEEGKVSVGHKWNKWTVDQTSGQHKHTCQECHITEYGEHDYVTTQIIPANCTQPEKIISKCNGCEDVKTEISTEHLALGHAWIINSITKDMHNAKCAKCQEEKDDSHDWSESNLCSVCKYDGLDYELEGTHCYVIGDSRVPLAKKIEIPEKHKNLLESGQYDTTEYTVKGIKKNAFYRHTNITKLLFPATVEYIEKYAFSNCFKLADVEIEGDTSALTRIEDSAFLDCWALVSFECPESVTKIGNYAFNNCKSLSKITISDNVTEIGSNAFSQTAYVNDSTHWSGEILYLGKHLIKARHHMLDDGTFSNKEVVVNPGTLTIAAKAFSECENLEKLTIPNTITFIDSDAFLNCKSINHVEFTGDLHEWLAIEFVNDYSSPLCYGQTGLHIEKAHDKVDLTQSPRPITKIPAGTFKNTGIKSIKFSKTVTYIGEEAFMNCSQLTSIEFEEGCKITYVGMDAFTGSAYFLDEENNWTEDGVLYIGTMLIKAKTTLADEYNITDGTTVVADYAFEGCNLLTSVIIDSEVERVGVEAFKGCSSMQNVTFENTEYIWIVTIKDQISRGFDKDDLNWGSLQSYNGGWKRAYKDTSEKLN